MPRFVNHKVAAYVATRVKYSVRRTAASVMSNADLRTYPRVLEALAHW